MRKFIFFCCILLLFSSLSACSSSQDTKGNIPANTVVQPNLSPVSSILPSSITPTVTTLPSTPPTISSSVTSSPNVTPTIEQTPVGMAPEPSNSAEMYSSYAHMVSFDPARGWADFDYFDMLKGDDAVKWLVEHEGYTQVAAQKEVDDFSDSEYIEKNTNKQLRTIDLKNVTLKLMYHSNGKKISGADPINATIDDIEALYALNKSYVLDTHFYYIKVQNGKVVSVSQVYWP